MDTEQTDAIDIGVDEQLSEIFDTPLLLANPDNVVEQEVSEVKEYQKNESKEGDCYIFNYQEFVRMAPRNGSKKDADRLEHDFSQLNLVVHLHNNLTSVETFEVLLEVSRKDYSKSKYVICCFLTHGGKDTLWAKDGSMNIDDILTIFSKSPSLKGIPKIFIIQACRGKKAELPISVDSTDSVITNEPEDYLDFLIANSTYVDTVSYKTSDEEAEKCHGSFFIDELCHSLEEFSSCRDLIQILTIVNHRMANNFLSHCKYDKERDKKKQMPCFTSTLRRKVEFNRKIKLFVTRDTQYFEKRRKRHGSNQNSDQDLKYDIKKAERVLCLSIVDKNIGKKDSSVRSAVCSLSTDFALKKYNRKNFNDKFKNFKILEYLEQNSLSGNGNESKEKDSLELDCLICYIAAYSRFGSICDEDGKKILKEKIIEKFIRQQTKSLAGKPKIFIFLLCKFENEKLPGEKFLDYSEPVSKSGSNNEYNCTRSDNVDGNNDSTDQSTEGTFDTNNESTDAGCISENLIPVHADILEIYLTVTDWKHIIGPMDLFSEIMKKSPTEDLLSLLTEFNFELVEKHNFFKMSKSCDMSKNSFTMTSTLTKTLFLP